MRVVPKRSAAILLAGVLAVSVAAVTRAATAEEVPSAAKVTDPTPKPPRIRPADPTGAQPVELEVQLTSAAGTSASARRLGTASGASAVDLLAKPGPDQVVVTVRADEASAALAALRKDSAVKSAKVRVRYYASDVEPNDPWSWRQGVGQPASSTEEGYNLSRTSVPAAWKTTTGSSDVTVAVIDSGVTAVPDLAGSLLPGKNFVTRVDGRPTNNTTDDDGHGTMVASLIGANTDNGLGIAAACWLCRILPVKVLDKNGIGHAADVADGIRWAVDNGADIINLSLGGDPDPELAAAVRYAVDADVVVIAAAGNSGLYNVREYPAGYPGVISVGATDGKDQAYPFSNYGDWVTLAAPGLAWMTARDGEPDQAYGTSMSAPLVAGVAGLVLSAHPTATDTQVKNALIDTTDPISAFRGGRLNAARAVAALPFTGKAQPSIRITGPARNAPFPSTVTVGVVTGADTVSVQGTVPGADGPVDIGTDTTAPWSVAWTPAPAAVDGEHVITVVATDAGGDKTTTTLPVVLDRGVPTITGATPAQLKKVKGIVTVGATGVSDAGSGVAYAALHADGVLVGKDTSAPYAVKYTSTKRNGTVKLEWRVFDRAGNSTVYRRSIVADNTAPKVKISSGPKNKAKVKGTVKLKVTASDKYGVNRVELLVNGKVVATDKTSAYTFSVKVSKFSRKMKVQVRAVDSVGHVAYDTTRNWTR